MKTDDRMLARLGSIVAEHRRRSRWSLRIGGRGAADSELFPRSTDGREVIRAFLDGFGEMAASLPLEQLETTGRCVVSLSGLDVPLDQGAAFELCELWAEGAADLRRTTYTMTPTRVQRIRGWAEYQRRRAIRSTRPS